MIALFLILVSSVVANYTPEDSLAPCNFFSTINITDGIKQPNGSIFYKNIEYLETQYAEYNYNTFNSDDIIKVPIHIRGCLCEKKDCIRVCCEYGKAVRNGSCVNYDLHDVLFNSTIGSNLAGNKSFEFIYGKPCKMMFKRNPANESSDDWELLKVS